MQSIKLETTINIPLDRIQDLLIGAFDPVSHAVSYWCDIKGYRKPKKLTIRESKDEIYRYCDYPVNEGGAIFLVVDTGDKKDELYGKEYELGLPEIEKGLKLMQSTRADDFADLMNENEDNDTSDVFVQLCLFGELIYG